MSTEGLPTFRESPQYVHHGESKVILADLGHCKRVLHMIDRVEKEIDMLTRHFQILRLVIQNEPIGIVKLSQKTGYPRHKVRYSLRVLEEESLIEPSQEGAVTTNKTQRFVNAHVDSIDEVIARFEGMEMENSIGIKEG